MTYRIQLQDYEGPLDLLLLLIQRAEIDIFDIPIAQITDEYLAHVREMEAVDLDSVADFIYFAALLISIKARLLIPKEEYDESDEIVDPRQELVERLVDYVRYKRAADELDEKHAQRARLFTRGKASEPPEADIPPDTVLVNTRLFDLVGALRHILAEAPEDENLMLRMQDYSVEDQRTFVSTWLNTRKRGSFSGMVHGYPKNFIIATFLAILEMAQQRLVALEPSADPDDFEIIRMVPRHSVSRVTPVKT